MNDDAVNSHWLTGSGLSSSQMFFKVVFILDNPLKMLYDLNLLINLSVERIMQGLQGNTPAIWQTELLESESALLPQNQKSSEETNSVERKNEESVSEDEYDILNASVKNAELDECVSSQIFIENDFEGNQEKKTKTVISRLRQLAGGFFSRSNSTSSDATHNDKKRGNKKDKSKKIKIQYKNTSTRNVDGALPTIVLNANAGYLNSSSNDKPRKSFDGRHEFSGGHPDLSVNEKTLQETREFLGVDGANKFQKLPNQFVILDRAKRTDSSQKREFKK